MRVWELGYEDSGTVGLSVGVRGGNRIAGFL